MKRQTVKIRKQIQKAVLTLLSTTGKLQATAVNKHSKIPRGEGVYGYLPHRSEHILRDRNANLSDFIIAYRMCAPDYNIP